MRVILCSNICVTFLCFLFVATSFQRYNQTCPLCICVSGDAPDNKLFFWLINSLSRSLTNETFNPATQTKQKLQRPFCKWSKHRSLKQEQQTWRQLSETTWTAEGKLKLQTAFVLLHRWWVKQTRGAEDVRTQSGRAHTAGDGRSELVLKSGCITYMSIISLTNIWKFFSSNFQNRLFLL